MNQNTLILVGSGIKFMSHLTIESKACIEKADKVLFLVNEPLMQEWILRVNSNAESLDEIYKKTPQRHENYLLIADYIIENLKKYQTLCVVMYGHPTMLVQPSIYAANIAIENGYKVIVMPGISAEDCLYADLLINPISCGCQSYEATDFLIHKRKYDSGSHLIIWQPSVIGILGLPGDKINKNGLELLVNYLKNKYELTYKITLYEAAQYPDFKPRIEKIYLKDLPEAKLTRLTTLYIPPNKINKPSRKVISSLRR